MKNLIVIYTTCSSKKEAEKISQVLLEKKLAACCNIFKINSLFFWKGKLEKVGEWAIFIKTKKKLFKEIKKTIKKIHSYSLPCIISFPIENGEKDFLNWIVKSTKNL